MREIYVRNSTVIAIMEPDSGYQYDAPTYKVESDDMDIGLGWNYEDGVFSPLPPPATRCTKADFTRRFTHTERILLNGLRREIAALPLEAYQWDDATGPNPYTLLLAAEDVMFAFEQPAEFIELNHPDTFQGLMLLSYVGILTYDRVVVITTL